MNKYFISLAAVGAAMFCGMTFTSCSDDDTDALTGGLSVQAVSPTKVIEGQEVSITGTGLDKVTAVVFPGGVKATDIKKVGSGLISVVTPANIAEEGGIISVEADGESAESRMQLTVGHPVVNTVAPVGEEIAIGGNIQVYGADLEFMAKAIFPGADGNEVVVNSSEFRRKSTSALYIYVPAGISAGEAQVKLVDVSGKTYTLPTLLLSDKIGGGPVEDPRAEALIWDGDYSGSWDFLEMKAGDLYFNGIVPRVGEQLKFVFENTVSDSRFCICLGENWAAPDLGGENDPNNVSIANATEFIVTITEDFLTEITGGIMRIGGVNFNLKKVYYSYYPSPTVWKGEGSVNQWLYIKAGDLYRAEITAEEGDTLRFIFNEDHPDAPFNMYTLWWEGVDLGNGGAAEITIPAGQTEFDWTINASVANAMNNEDGSADCFIIGGNGTMTLLEVQVIKQ